MMIPNEDCLTAAEQIYLHRLLYKQKLSGGRCLFFMEALTEIFPGSDCYYHVLEKIFILSLPYKRDERNEERMNYLRYWFFDVTARLQTYWEYPFGIIGFKKTMIINQMRIHGARKDL